MAVDFSARCSYRAHGPRRLFCVVRKEPRCTLRTLPCAGVKVPRAVLVRRVHAVYVRRPQG